MHGPDWSEAGGRPVLVVDDDPDIRSVVAAILESEGYEVAVARDGHEALADLERRQPAVILLDLTMPRMDGFAFAEELVRRGLRASLSIIVMSAAGRAQHGARQLSAEGCMPKPFNVEDLLGQVARLSKYATP